MAENYRIRAGRRLAALAALLIPIMAVGALADTIRADIVGLSKADWRDRAAAAEALGASRSSDRAVVDALANALDDDDSRVRRSAAAALGNIGSKASRALPALIDTFDDIDPGVVAAAARAVGSMGSRASRAVEDLSRLTSHRDERVQVAAADALGMIGPRASKGAAELGRQLGDSDVAVRIAAAEALGAMGPRAEKQVTRLVQLLADEDADVRSAAADALLEIGKDAVPNLVRALEKGDPVFLQTVVETLGRMGSAAVPKLINKLESKFAPTLARRYAALALARIGPADRKVIPALVNSLEDDRAAIRVAALEALGRIGAAAQPAIDKIIKLARDQRQPINVRQQALSAMAAIAPGDARVAAALVAAVEDGNPEIYASAVAALVKTRSLDPSGSNSVQRVADLQRQLRGESAGSRVAAARALGEMGPFAAAAVPSLIDALADTTNDAELRVAAAQALGLIGEAAEAAVPELIRALNDPNSRLSDAALVSLNRIGPQTQTIPALLQAMRSGDLETRAAAAQKVREFARARMETWLSILGRADAPVLRNWLARYEPLYGVAIDDNLMEPPGSEDAPDYFDVLGGRAAVRETMQLDLIADPLRSADESRRVPIDSIDGVEVRSHPFKEMLEASDARARRVALAELIPKDRFFAWFGDIGVMQAALDNAADQFLRFESALSVKSVDYEVRDQYFARFGLAAGTLDQLQTLGAVRELAIISPDLFFVDGTDITIVATLASGDVTRSVLNLLGLARPPATGYATHTTNDGGEVFWTIRGDTLFMSTNRREIEKVLALQAENGEGSLGASAEFLYMQQQLGIDAQTDAYLYFSDAFIRRLVSPEVKIAQLRRMQARAEMEMLVSGAMLYMLDGNRHVPSKEQLVRHNYVPEHFGARDYEISDELIVRSGLFGSIADLKPLSVQNIGFVSNRERDAYNRYVESYSNYWQQFFDPIAVRIDGLDDEVTEVTTFILPLLDSQLFDQVRDALATNETGQRLDIPVLSPAPSLLLSLNLSDDLRLSMSRLLTDMLVRYTSVDPQIFDSIGSGVHLAVRDSMPIVALGGGDVWGALDREMLQLEGFDSLLPMLFSLVTQPATVFIELDDPEQVQMLLSAAVSMGAESDDRGQLHKLQDKEAWIYTLDIEGLIQVHLRLEIKDGYLLIGNLPWSTRLEIEESRRATLNGAMLTVNFDEIEQQLPALHTKIFADYRAAAVDGMGYLYPLLLTGISDTVEAAMRKHFELFGFRPVHPSTGNWYWRDSYLISSQFGTASYPVQPEHQTGDRDFGLFPTIAVLDANMQLEDTGLRATVRWRSRQ